MGRTFTTKTAEETVLLGQKIGKNLKGGEVIELKSDLGGGKTTLTRGIAKGFGSSDLVASPSFTISNVYKRLDGKELHHFDFYRLDNPGVVGAELDEIISDDSAVTVVEWGGVVASILPEQRMTVDIFSESEDRRLVFDYPDDLAYLLEGL